MSAVDGPSREERLFRISVGSAVAFAATAPAWGVLVRSQLTVFDGLYSTISVALSAMSLVAYRLIARGPDERHPFGREVLSAVVVLLRGVGATRAHSSVPSPRSGSSTPCCPPPSWSASSSPSRWSGPDGAS